MSVDALDSSKENIARAKRKFKNLVLAINTYIQSNPYSIRIEKDANLFHVIARRDKDIDIDVSFDCVEIVLRMRAALDKAVVAMVERNRVGTSGVGFPFGGIDRNTGKPQEFPCKRMTGNQGLKKKLTTEQWDFLCAQRPYPGGNDSLWAINEIANTDKHRSGLVRIQPRLSPSFSLGNGFVDQFSMVKPKLQTGSTEDKRETVLMSMGAALRQQNINSSFAIGVVFADGFGVDGRDVSSALNEQIRQVDCIVKGISLIVK